MMFILSVTTASSAGNPHMGLGFSIYLCGSTDFKSSLRQTCCPVSLCREFMA